MKRADNHERVWMPYRLGEATVTILSSQREINHALPRIAVSVRERTYLLLGRFGRRLKRAQSLPA